VPAQRRRTLITVLAVACGLALGIGATVAFTRDGGDRQLAEPGEVDDLNEPEPADAPPGADAPDPRSAVEGFLDAEIAGDFATSFGYLSAATRAGFGSPARWIASHADLVPPVESYEIEEVGEPDARQARAEVLALVSSTPSLDQVVGLVPARSRVRWVTAGSAGSWGVDLGASTFEPLYPPDDQAPGAVRAWADALQSCGEAPTWEGSLVGSPALADPLCGSTGEIQVGGAERPDDVEVAPLLTAFGPEAAEWARVVPVSAPVALKAVVAPVGEQWLVIGVLPPN